MSERNRKLKRQVDYSNTIARDPNLLTSSELKQLEFMQIKLHRQLRYLATKTKGTAAEEWAANFIEKHDVDYAYALVQGGRLSPKEEREIYQAMKDAYNYNDYQFIVKEDADGNTTVIANSDERKDLNKAVAKYEKIANERWWERNLDRKKLQELDPDKPNPPYYESEDAAWQGLADIMDKMTARSVIVDSYYDEAGLKTAKLSDRRGSLKILELQNPDMQAAKIEEVFEQDIDDLISQNLEEGSNYKTAYLTALKFAIENYEDLDTDQYDELWEYYNYLDEQDETYFFTGYHTGALADIDTFWKRITVRGRDNRQYERMVKSESVDVESMLHLLKTSISNTDKIMGNNGSLFSAANNQQYSSEERRYKVLEAQHVERLKNAHQAVRDELEKINDPKKGRRLVIDLPKAPKGWHEKDNWAFGIDPVIDELYRAERKAEREKSRKEAD